MGDRLMFVCLDIFCCWYVASKPTNTHYCTKQNLSVQLIFLECCLIMWEMSHFCLPQDLQHCYFALNFFFVVWEKVPVSDPNLLFTRQRIPTLTNSLHLYLIKNQVSEWNTLCRPSCNLQGWNMKPMQKCQKLQSLEWPFEAGSIPHRPPY